MGKIFGVWIKTNTVLTRLKKNKIKKEINAFITIKCEYGLESHLFRIRGTPEILKETRDSIHTPAGVGVFNGSRGFPSHGKAGLKTVAGTLQHEAGSVVWGWKTS